MTLVGFVVEGSFKNRCTISLLWVECEGRKIHNLTGNILVKNNIRQKKRE